MFFEYKDDDEFPEMKTFIRDIEELLSVEIFKEEVRSIKDELALEVKNEGLEFVILGNRWKDPYSLHLKTLEESSPGWPVFTWVFPVLNWTYSDVWNFLKGLELPYCSLYDEGFTSIGRISKSQPNPHLKYTEND